MCIPKIINFDNVKTMLGYNWSAAIIIRLPVAKYNVLLKVSYVITNQSNNTTEKLSF